MILLFWVLLAIYIVHVLKGDVVPKQQKVLWIFLLIFGGIGAMIVYWVLFIWRSPGVHTGA